METFIEFLPIVIYSLIGTALFYLKKITFNNQITLLILALVAHVTISIMHGNWTVLIGQVLIATAAFALMVYFFAGKTSGETILTMASILLLSPLPDGLIPMIIVFILILITAAIQFRKKTESLKWLLFDAASSTGLAYATPDYSHLPDRSTLTDEDKRTSLLPYMASVMTVTALYYLLQPLFLDS